MEGRYTHSPSSIYPNIYEGNVYTGQTQYASREQTAHSDSDQQTPAGIPPGFQLLATTVGQNRTNDTASPSNQRPPIALQQQTPSQARPILRHRYKVALVILGVIQLLNGLAVTAIAGYWSYYFKVIQGSGNGGNDAVVLYAQTAAGIFITLAGVLGISGHSGLKRSVLVTCLIFCAVAALISIGGCCFYVSVFAQMNLFTAVDKLRAFLCLPSRYHYSNAACAYNICRFTVAVICPLEVVAALVQLAYCCHVMLSMTKKPQQFTYYICSSSREQVATAPPAGEEHHNQSFYPTGMPPPIYSTYERST